MTAYYNDNDRHVAAWLRELIKAGLITEGDVDERSIRDVKGSDLNGYNRVHFFAGIGGWDYALQLAGWPSDRYVWTGSCPCQPFSGAGQRKGERDERHLWPEFYRLISECRPATVFGEQVASNDGREWIAGVRSDLEALGYAVGAADLCAAGEGAPHIRQRLFWVADRQGSYGRLSVFQRQSRQKDDESVRGGETERLAESTSGQEHASAERGLHAELGECGNDSGVVHPDSPGCGKQCSSEPIHTQQRPVECSSGQSYWANSILIPCGDGKARRIEPGLSPLVNGLPGRVGLLRGYGNSIVPEVAAKFIKAFFEVNP